MGEKLDVAKDVFEGTVGRECQDAWQAFVDAIGASGRIELHPSNCACGDEGCKRLLAFRRYIRAYLRLKKRQGQLDRMAERVKERAKLDEYDQAFMDSLANDAKLIEREVLDAQGKP